MQYTTLTLTLISLVAAASNKRSVDDSNSNDNSNSNSNSSMKPMADASQSAPVAESSMSPQSTCVLQCAASDVSCKAACVGVPNPSNADVGTYNDCAFKCTNSTSTDTGSPDASATANCLKQCQPILYPSASSAKPKPSASGSKSGSGSAKSHGSMGDSDSAANTIATTTTFFTLSAAALAFGL